MTDKKPVPPSLAQFALEQLAEAGEQAAIDLTVQNVEILRAEIAKRDARIANLERLLNNTSEIAQAVEQELAALKAQQLSAGVVLPERKSLDDEWHSLMKYRAVGWNACLDEVARLNSYPASAGEYEAVEVIGYRVSMPGEPELGTWLDEEAEDEPQIQRHEPLMAVAQHEKIVASLKPCADGITAQDERAMFDVYICAEQGCPDGIDTTHIGATFAPWRAWQARARLDPSPTGSDVVLPEPDFYWIPGDESSWNSPEEWAQDYYDNNGEKPECVLLSCAVELPDREYDSFEFDENGNCTSLRLVVRDEGTRLNITAAPSAKKESGDE